MELMTILEKVRSDHQDSLSLLATIMAASDEQERNILFKQFLDEFIAHSNAAESQLYECLRTYEDSRYISLYAKEAHDLAVSFASNLATDPHKATARWTARCHLLKSMVEQHIQEEENSIFAAAKAVFDMATLRRMGCEFAEEKKKHLR
jgi:hemerythrin-like domain-containing protein